MPDAVKRQLTDREVLEQRLSIDSFRQQRTGARAEATRRAAGFPYIRGDLHMHTVYSDGTGSVDDMVRVAGNRGLDFLFVTDHGTVRQKLECRKWNHVWWGQEPGAGPHHVCILAGDRKLTPTGEMARDAAALREMGLFFFYPHPVGWYPRTWYSEEQKDVLAEAGPEFAIEVINGIFRNEAFHDEWTENNVALWDRYLCEGYRVIGLGATDSHFAPGVGNTWTGLVGVKVQLDSVLAGLRSGRLFASSGPAVNLSCGSVPMGGVFDACRKRKATVQIQCADSYGLNWVRVVQDGKMARLFQCKGRDRLSEQVKLDLSKADGYVRVECAALDDLRAYSNPIYFRR